jgi:PAS domain S-box-containing protein
MAHAAAVRVTPRAVGKYLAQLAIVFAVQFAAGKLGDALAINSGGIGPVWPASGIALAALLLFGYQVWPGVVAGAFLLAFLSPIPHIAAAVYAAGTTLTALLAVFLLRSIAGFDHSLSRLRDVLALVVLGAFGSSVVSASIGASTLYAAHIRGWSGLGSAWLIYWLGDSTGILVVTPIVLTLPTLFRIRDRHRLTEFAVLLLLLMATSFAAFGLLPLSPSRVHHLAFAVLPFVMWAAIRLGMGATALSILLLATIATVETALGSGPFTTNIPLMNAVLLDIFFAVVSVTGLTLAAAIAEREQAEREREQLVREQAAMEARLRLATIVESSDDAIIGMDMNGRITDWNKGAERLYGYSAGEVIGQMISLLVPPGRSDDCGEIMSKVKHGDRVSHHEIECQKKDGTCVEVSLTVSPIIDTEGRSTGSSAITRDITELKRQGAVLRESEERFRLVADTAPVLMWMSETDKLCTYFNKPWLEFTGRSLEQELGNGWAEGVHPEDLLRCLDTYTQSFDRREKFRMEYRLRRHDGEYRWILDIGVPRFGQDRSFVGYIGIGVDVTDRKRAEEALRESEDKLRLLLDSTAEAIYGIDLNHRCTFCNPACLRALGYERADEVLGKNMHNLIHHTRADGTSFPIEECRVHRVTRTGEGVHAEDEVLWRANGTSFPAEYWSYPQRRENEVVGAVVAFIDITERKLAEAALASVSRKLIEAQEQERTRIGRELHDDICQRLALLAIESQQLHEDPLILPEVRSRMGKLQKQISEIADDIQSLSHELHSAKLQYLGIAAAMRGFCREFGEQQKVEIDFEVHDLPGPLSADISLCLFRVLQEALHNSAKHSGVRHFEVRLWGTSDEIHVTVQDSGAGFDRKAAKASRGLGLISMEERLKLVNGTLSIDSQPKRGTTIHARVPLSAGGDSLRAAG